MPEFLLPPRSNGSGTRSYVVKRGAPVGANRLRALMSAVFALGVKLGHAASNPVTATSRTRERGRDRLIRARKLLGDDAVVKPEVEELIAKFTKTFETE